MNHSFHPSYSIVTFLYSTLVVFEMLPFGYMLLFSSDRLVSNKQIRRTDYTIDKSDSHCHHFVRPTLWTAGGETADYCPL